MPILTQDIKLLKSAVMADTSDGGGAMTGIEVIDGQSNNLFPDTSALDRAFGRVNLRKVFGAAHTLDTDTLLGAHAIITDAPDDPLVHSCLVKTSGWADTRTSAREAIERYLVKGPRLSTRLYDAHYAGSLQIRLISFVNDTFPAGGDALVLRNPNGQEQYVRVLNVTVTATNVAVVEGAQTLVLPALVATCDIGQPLAFDFFGSPPARFVNEANFASIFSTNLSGGAKFYGIKPLGAAGVPGDFSVTTTGGIYTPLVPAATIESPIIDQLPLTSRASLVRTGLSALNPGTINMAWGPGASIGTPGPIEPGSVSIGFAGTTFTDDATGVLKTGAVDVGTVDYMAGRITLNASSPNYGTAILVLAYKPATVVGASSFSAALKITVANQGLAYTTVFEPPPAPGSFSLSFMAQGRWYTLKDNLSGKVAGIDGSYGVGTINYATGSFAVTLGAIPDIGSSLLADWGDPSAAMATPVADLPGSLSMLIPLDAKTQGSGIALSWVSQGTTYNATTDANGVLTGGNANGRWGNGQLLFAPLRFPDGNVSVTSQVVALAYAAVTNNGGGSYSLTGALPIKPGTFTAQLLVTYPADAILKISPLPVYDAGGVLFAVYSAGVGQWGATLTVGSIDYLTGAVSLLPGLALVIATNAEHASIGWTDKPARAVGFASAFITFAALTGVSYAAGVTSATVQSIAPGPWVAAIDTRGVPCVVSGSVLYVGNEFYSTAVGVVRRGWSLATATPLAVAGTISSEGLLSITQAGLPANRQNQITWLNQAQDASGKGISAGVFRTASAPLKTGVMQLQVGASVGVANDAGVISGGGFTGTVDFVRGLVTWQKSTPIDPALLSYNAVFLQFLPLDGSLLGLDTARLPLDGKVPLYRSGDLLVVHNTLTTVLPNPLVKNTAYSLGRVRLASVRVKDALGVVVPDTLYQASLNPGTITVPTAAVITPYTQPFTVEHRIEDMLLCSQADISGQLKVTRSLTHNFPAGTSYVSSAMPFGDLFARAHNSFEQQTWIGAWFDTLAGPVITANYNQAQYPIAVTNKGAITERWALIFTNTTAFRIVGENVGDIGTGTTGAVCSPNNPATAAPYFIIPETGWGNGWAAGNVLRFNTAACGSPFWAVRTVLQGPASLDSDAFTLAFRGDVDRP